MNLSDIIWIWRKWKGWASESIRMLGDVGGWSIDELRYTRRSQWCRQRQARARVRNCRIATHEGLSCMTGFSDCLMEYLLPTSCPMSVVRYVGEICRHNQLKVPQSRPCFRARPPLSLFLGAGHIQEQVDGSRAQQDHGANVLKYDHLTNFIGKQLQSLYKIDPLLMMCKTAKQHLFSDSPSLHSTHSPISIGNSLSSSATAIKRNAVRSRNFPVPPKACPAPASSVELKLTAPNARDTSRTSLLVKRVT